MPWWKISSCVSIWLVHAERRAEVRGHMESENALSIHAKPVRCHNKAFHERNREEESESRDDTALQPIYPRNLDYFELHLQVKPNFHHEQALLL